MKKRSRKKTEALADGDAKIMVPVIDEIRARLESVAGRRWRYDPAHEMAVGTTNSIEMVDRHIDLGRDFEEWIPRSQEEGGGYRLAEISKRRRERNRALGRFLENCREDIAWLLEENARLRRSIERCSGTCSEEPVELGDPVCPHERLDADGICRRCGKECRGIG